LASPWRSSVTPWASQAPKALPGSAGEGDVDGVLGQAGMTVAARDLADSIAPMVAVGVVHARRELDRDDAFERRPRLGDELLVEHGFELVVCVSQL